MKRMAKLHINLVSRDEGQCNISNGEAGERQSNGRRKVMALRRLSLFLGRAMVAREK